MAKRRPKRNQQLNVKQLKTKQVKTSELKANRKYKDTIFRMLFSDKGNLLSLYNAVNGTTYTDPEQLQIVTLKNAVYMGMKNDLAFIIDTNLFLYEHQSTYNPNMPMRDLFYIASEYQKLVDGKSLYSSTLQKVPAPKFLVFYNGTKEMEDSRTEYLSEAFQSLTGEPDLELKVTTLNINKGHNRELMEQCKVLGEYAQYVDRVRDYVEKMGLDTGVSRAVKECIQEGILTEFLRQNKAEAEKVSIFEYNKEEEERKLREAEYEGGWEAGKQAGMKFGMEEGMKAGMEAGMEEGMKAGMKAGIQMAREFQLEEDEAIKFLCTRLDVDEKIARKMLEEQE